MAHGPIQGDAHGARHVQAGVKFAVNALHDRKLFHAGVQFLVGQGIELGVFDGHRSLPGEGGQQVLILFHERVAIFAVDDFQHADDAVLDLQRHGQDGLAHETGLLICSREPARGGAYVIGDDRGARPHGLADDPDAGRHPLSGQVSGHRAGCHLENQFVGLLV